jgi:hypothetical protein
MADFKRLGKGVTGALSQAKQLAAAEKAMSKAAESAGMKAPVTANKPLTTTQDFHTSLGDSIRQRVARDQAVMDSFNYKYDKGQRVFTEDSAQKNWPPMTVLSRALEGNRMMREDPNDFLSKKIIDPETGKAKRTPPEPGYRVRLEHSPDNWSEFLIPESAIKGSVDMARGGFMRKVDGGKVAKGVAGALTKAKQLASAKREANLQKFIEPSKAKERLYHGTGQGDISAFNLPPRKKVPPGYMWGQKGDETYNRGVFLSPDPEMANHFAKRGTKLAEDDAGQYAVYPVRAQIEKPFDYENPEHREMLAQFFQKQYDEWHKGNPEAKRMPDVSMEHLLDNPGINFQTIESPEMLHAIEKLGFDSFYTSEGKAKNIGVFDPRKIKSDIGNRGTYDITDPDINKADGGKIAKGVTGALKKATEAAKAKKVAPQEEAMRLAQQRAALPPAKGGLGLPADNTPAQRAKAMGFDTDVYHGSKQDFDKFKGDQPVFAAEDPDIAGLYGNAIYPLKLRGEVLEVSDLGKDGASGRFSNNLAKELKIPRKELEDLRMPKPLFDDSSILERLESLFIKKFGDPSFSDIGEREMVNKLPKHGIDRLKVTDMSDMGGTQTQHMIPAGSDNIRSRFAAFDPFRKDAAIAAAMGVLAPDLLAKENDEHKAKGGVIHMADAGKVTKGVVGALTKATEMAKAEKAVPKVDRLSMSYKDVTKRVPEVADALEQLLKGDITKAQYNDIVNTYKPVTPYSFVPKPATKDEAVGALRGDAAKERYGKQAEYTPGSKIGLRLDIPAYTGKGVWVNSIHDEKAKKVAYGPVASVKNADLGISQAESKRIAQGGAKAPYARIKGEWNPISEEEAIAKAQEYLDHPEWRQIGMDPERHSYFYDRRTMQPITNAEEIIQIGPLVLGKNPKYANIDEFDYATGGKVRHMADAGRVTKGVTGALTKAKEMAQAKKASESKIAEMLAAQQAPMTTPSGTGLPLMPRDQGMYTPREQKDLPRMPTVDKARAANKSPKYNERMQDLLDSPTARKKVDSLINKGKDLNMKEWYGTEPLRQVAMDAGRTPEQFESLMAQLASASQRNPVDKQNQMGSYLYHLSETGQLPENSLLLTNKLKKALKEDPSLAEGRTLIELPTGYGSLAQGDIFNRAVMIGQGNIGEALPPNKKLGTFYENLLGNLQPVTVDVNAVRGPIIERGDPRWLTSKLVEKDETGKVINSYKPREMLESGEMTLREAKQRPGFWEAAPSGSEYAGFEELWQRGAKRHDVAPAEAQALGWYGSADVTALKTKPENYVDNLERLIKRTAEQTGKSPTEVMNDMVTGKGFLRKEGGAVKREESPEDMARFHKRFAMHKAIGGRVNKQPAKMAEGGKVSIFDKPAKMMSKGGSSDEPTAREIAEQLGKLAVDQGKEEYESFKKPRAATDIGNRGILAPALGLPVDMMNMGLSGVDALTGLMGKPTRLSSEKPFAGSEHIKDLMDRYGVTSGEDRPMTETMLSLFSPTGMIKGAQGMTKGAVKAADAMRRPRAGAMREKTN